MSEQLYHIPELLWSFLMAVVRALSPGRKISDLPPSITKTVTIVVSLTMPQPRFFCMVTQVRVCAGQARPLTNTAASQTLARSDGEIGGSKMRP